MSTVPLRPQQPVLDLIAKLAPGPVLDVPFANPLGWPSRLAHLPHYALLRTYHQRRIAGCATSLGSPAEPDVGALAARLPGDPRAADALYALGFRNVVVHHEFLFPRQRTPWEDAASEAVDDSRRLRSLGQAEQHAAFALESPTPIDASLTALAPGTTMQAELPVEPGETVVPFAIRNRSVSTYRHPDPIEPTTVVVRWRGAGGDSWFETRTLLPLALAAGEETQREVETPVVAAPGRYEVTLELPDTQHTVLGRRTVEVRAAGG
jgi:hypothetical protein